jgi:hypothetical protein
MKRFVGDVSDDYWWLKYGFVAILRGLYDIVNNQTQLIGVKHQFNMLQGDNLVVFFSEVNICKYIKKIFSQFKVLQLLSNYI